MQLSAKTQSIRCQNCQLERLKGYVFRTSTSWQGLPGFWGHAVGKNNIDIQALIGAAPEFVEPGFILPARNRELFGWCLKHGLRVREPLTLMSMGLYNEPQGVFLPSIVY